MPELKAFQGTQGNQGFQGNTGPQGFQGTQGNQGSQSGIGILQNGLNTYTGGTAQNPSVNISAATLNNLSVSGSNIIGNFIGNNYLFLEARIYIIYLQQVQQPLHSLGIFKEQDLLMLVTRMQIHQFLLILEQMFLQYQVHLGHITGMDKK